jgi:hypothetical protein
MDNEILKNNDDLAGSCAYEPPTSMERPGLPGEEHKAALQMTWTDRLAMAGCYALVFGVLPALFHFTGALG